MMEENQFHYTLITTYSSGRHLSQTQAGPTRSQCGSTLGGEGLSLCLFPPSLVLNYINASLMRTMCLPALFKSVLRDFHSRSLLFEGCHSN